MKGTRPLDNDETAKRVALARRRAIRKKQCVL